jgi:hypothetical protein
MPICFRSFPSTHVAEALRDGHMVEPQSQDITTVLYSDIIGFTKISSALTPIKVSDMLGYLYWLYYSRFNELTHLHARLVEFTKWKQVEMPTWLLEQIYYVKQVTKASNKTFVDVHEPSKGFVNTCVGFHHHSGPVVANVVSLLKPGDVMNNT